ncbi:MAG: hypothetical protein M3N18_08615 [Actinomycetota bacterium]|nr:hypothetical protein [Actinomycetota bacterium]
MNAYSKDLKMRVLATVDRGTAYGEVSRLFGVSLATNGRYARRRRDTGEVAPRPSPGTTARICNTAEERRALWAQLEESPEATLERRRELWEQGRGVRVSVATMSPAVRKLERTFGKSRRRPPSATRGSGGPNAYEWRSTAPAARGHAITTVATTTIGEAGSGGPAWRGSEGTTFPIAATEPGGGAPGEEGPGGGGGGPGQDLAVTL